MDAKASRKELPVFLTVKELAEMLRVKVRTIYSWVEADLIPYHKPGRTMIFRLDEIIDWLEKKRGGITDSRICHPFPFSVGSVCTFAAVATRERSKMPVRKRGNNWYFDIIMNGVRHRDLIPNARTKKQAEDAEIAFRQELFEARFKPKIEDVPLLSDFIDEHFLPWSRANKRSWYADGWRSKSLKKFFAGKRLDEITPLLIEKFKSKELEKISERGTKQRPA